MWVRVVQEGKGKELLPREQSWWEGVLREPQSLNVNEKRKSRAWFQNKETTSAKEGKEPTMSEETRRQLRHRRWNGSPLWMWFAFRHRRPVVLWILTPCSIEAPCIRPPGPLGQLYSWWVTFDRCHIKSLSHIIPNIFRLPSCCIILFRRSILLHTFQHRSFQYSSTILQFLSYFEHIIWTFLMSMKLWIFYFNLYSSILVLLFRSQEERMSWAPLATCV